MNDIAIDDSQLFPVDLLCEYCENPIGIDESLPRFSWKLRSTKLEHCQAGYQILVASSLDLLAVDNGNIWDSGKVSHSQCSAVSYAGGTLVSRQICYWKVRLWGPDGQCGTFSNPASFEMALLDAQDWKAEWVGWPAGRPGQAAYFRCSIDLDFVPSRARLYISGLGLYEAYVNGHKMDGLLQPAITSSERRVFYNTFDVTREVHRGENVLAAVVGTGWKGAPMLLAQLEVEGLCGGKLTVTTFRECGSPEWLTASGPIGKNSIFDGEIYDARKEKSGWELPGYDENAGLLRTEKWLPACRTNLPGGIMRAQPIEPIRVVRTIPAKSVSEPQPSVFVFDFGQNHAGWGSLHIKGDRGTMITLKYAEILGDDGRVNQENLRTAVSTDTYILKGGSAEVWEPRFTYHGYRYIEVEGWPGVPDIDSLIACVVRSDLRKRGHFFCDNPLLNRIHEMIVWTEESNLHGIPTDCPQRDERMGWLNDMAARSEELVYNFETARFLSKFVDDISDSQNPETGAITDTVPFCWGYQPADPVSIAYLLIPVLLHQHYGDTTAMNLHYCGMRQWVDFLSSQSDCGILGYSHFGDWAPPASEAIEGSDGSGAISAETPGALVSTAFYFQSLVLFSKISRILGKQGISDVYAERAAEVQSAFHQKFWNPDISGYGSGNQSCNAIALYFDLVPRELRKRVASALVADVCSHNYHLSTGNLATKYLFEVLADEGFIDVAFRVATQITYPSLGFMLANGATTLWERWEKLQGEGMNSHNHPMLGSIGAWFYRYVAGIRFGEPQQGSPQVIIKIPEISELSEAQARVETIYGEVSIAWKRHDTSVEVTAHIPWNCPASLQLPDAIRPLEPGDHVFFIPLETTNKLIL